MVNLNDLDEDNAKQKPIDPREIFNALPKPQGINDLYASQAEVLDAWHERRSDKDIVIKLHTGGGKTLVALLMAQSVMNETGAPVLYLAPTKQLVDQVLKMSKDYDVPALEYVRGELPEKFYTGEAVLVGAYQALFNGRSRFGVSGSRSDIVSVGTIILDDAHVALSSVRDAFTLDISASDHEAVYRDLADRFRSAFKDAGQFGLFEDVINGKDFSFIEVPSWAWHQKINEVQHLLLDAAEEIKGLVWPFLRDNLDVCHCLFSKHRVSITPIFPLVDMLPTFRDAERRIYMSATISDDSEIVRTFDASKESIRKPITATTVAGIGERLILVPELMNFNAPSDELVKAAVDKFVADGKGVAILAPSRSAAAEWEDIADYPKTNLTVIEKVSAMKEGDRSRPLVLANRYDGIDLPEDACRLLIIDDLPIGASNYDLFRANVVDDAAVNSIIAQRIEQGIGRGTRGNADHCVIMLVGRKLVSWIGQPEKVKFLSASTKIQLTMGKKISEKISTHQEMDEIIQWPLKRDKKWVNYHASQLAKAAHTESVDQLTLEIAAAERKIFKLQRQRKFSKALAKIEKLISGKEAVSDKQDRAWFAALAARIAYQADDLDRGRKYQDIAFSINSNHSPPRVRPAYRPRTAPGRQSNAIVSLLSNFEPRATVIAHFDEATSNLVHDASSNSYEEALAKLGTFLGFVAERPDKVLKIGPDVLWRTEAAFDFVIEAKNKKKSGSPLFKMEHAQLLEAENWFNGQYPSRKAVRVSTLPAAFAHEQASPTGSFAFCLNEVTKVVSALRGLIQELVWSTEDGETLRSICEDILVKTKLKPDLMRDEFMGPFEKSKTTDFSE